MVFLAFVLTSGAAHAADDEEPWHVSFRIADSLKRLLDVEPLTEKRKLELYNHIAGQYAGSDQDSLLRYATKGIPLARKLKEYDMLVDCYIQAGAAHCFRANYDSAFYYFNLLESLSIERRNKWAETVAIGFYAYIYKIQGKYNSAIDYYLKALKIFESEGDYSERYVNTLTNLSEINRRLGNTEIALRYLEEAEKACHQIKAHNNYEWRLTSVLNEYAFNYLNHGDLDMALDYALQSDSINRNRYIVNLCYTHGILASIWLQRNDFDRAMQHALQSYEHAGNI